MILFGGQSRFENSNETWEYNGKSWRKIITPSEDKLPLPRLGHTLTYDKSRQVTLLFGGILATSQTLDNCASGIILSTDSANCFVNDTWEYDGIRWQETSPSNVEGNEKPLPRWRHATAYDESRGKAVFFGGQNNVSYDDTWEYDGQDWIQVNEIDPEGDEKPLARGGHAMTYDRHRKRVLLYGTHFALHADAYIWEYDGSSWKKHLPEDPEKDGHAPWGYNHGFAYDSRRNVTVLFGGLFDRRVNGEDCSGLLNQEFICMRGATWEYHEKSWKNIYSDSPNITSYPDSRFWAGATFDKTRKVGILFGGSKSGYEVGSDCGNGTQAFLHVGEGHCIQNDTWEYDGDRWNEIIPLDLEEDGNPIPRKGPGITYDSHREVTVLFGGIGTTQPQNTYLSDTWEYNGVSWQDKTPANIVEGTYPSARRLHAMAYDDVRNVVVLFGGQNNSSAYLDDLWEYDGSSWNRVNIVDPEGDGNPTARWSSIAFDEKREVMLDL